ncbi:MULTISPECIES: biotin/lipoyl-binding protein [Acidobacterium]|uniref:Efflux ABC transporter, membrane fusion protein (MFP) family n=1 Tax=Acidobacterium capsulatum (strain ATCC 51196 / DSM 11244 / BCRC 80197 / JCM 7670 / NBRC 15755 / NCIMB 13165 / 161) TaxID=240015 RepID=C1F1Y5_ACIC5|nr:MULTISPECIES: biotin/lipoyl-binding protein [Acidobacterium]ACO31351.1 efflux ABC transporter, membrane fusion protein (MFP) family [Acidobacterium capsulatum ATCC 51196]HCT61264.1 glycosyl hydrolase family 18 [Acidobacterium sp.]
MKTRWLFVLASIGLLGACVAAYFSSRVMQAQQPMFQPASNPYSDGIYAEGIVESAQSSGTNLNLYPEVAGTVSAVLVKEGQSVKKGQKLLQIDDTIQNATTRQLQAQAAAAHTMLNELRAEPRPESLAVSAAQVAAAQAQLKTSQDTLTKQQDAYRADTRTVSQDALDNAKNAARVAAANLTVAENQYALTKAGAWSYDIQNQERQWIALTRAYQAAQALLGKYALVAPRDATVMAINTAPGAYVSPQGAYDAYTQGTDPVISLSANSGEMEVRCYVDEILISRLPPPAQIHAQMTIRGTDVHLPLTFERMQPLVSPKIELSNQRLERVDVRVLPLIFRLRTPKGVALYPGELVDVYIGK